MHADTGLFICLSVSDVFLFYFASNVCFPFLSFLSWSFLRKISSPALFLSTRLCAKRWCDVPGFVPAGSVSSFSTLFISLFICLPVCLLGHFPSLQHVWGSTSTGGVQHVWGSTSTGGVQHVWGSTSTGGVQHVWGSTSTGGGCRILKHASLGFPFHFNFRSPRKR